MINWGTEDSYSDAAGVEAAPVGDSVDTESETGDDNDALLGKCVS